MKESDRRERFIYNTNIAYSFCIKKKKKKWNSNIFSKYNTSIEYNHECK